MAPAKQSARRQMLPSGGARLFDNRVGWAKSHITQAGLLEAPRRAVSKITEQGHAVLRDHPDRLDLRILNEFEDHRAFRNRRRTPQEIEELPESDNDGQTPEEMLDNAYFKVRRQIEAELLEQIMTSPPDFLERVVVDLVVGMGYGGTRQDAGEATMGIFDQIRRAFFLFRICGGGGTCVEKDVDIEKYLSVRHRFLLCSVEPLEQSPKK